MAASLPLPLPSRGAFPVDQISSPPVTRTLSSDLGPTLMQDELTSILALIPSAETPFPNKVIVTGTALGARTYLLGGHNSTHYRAP